MRNVSARGARAREALVDLVVPERQPSREVVGADRERGMLLERPACVERDGEGDRRPEARHAQDNEQWHLVLLGELVARRHIARSWWTARAIPQLLAVLYYHVSWLFYVVDPRELT